MAGAADDGPQVTPTTGAAGETAYPDAWEADVVLHDGSTTHVRPIRPSDADALQAFHVGQSERSTYMRFFAPLERLSDRDLHRLVAVDHQDRAALVAVASGSDGEQIIAVARYDRIGTDDAEVAFNVADAHQGRGLGSVLLEHLAAAARERGVRRFVAEVLPQNGRMIGVFRDAGFEIRQHTDDGVVTVTFDIDPTDRSLEVMADREHRAEARSVRALLTARSVVVLGPGEGADPASMDARAAARVLESLAQGDPGVQVHVVGVAMPAGGADAPPAHVRAWPTLEDVPEPVDLAVVAVGPHEAPAAVRALAPLGVRGVVLLSTGFAETGPAGLERQRSLLRTTHGLGMRLVGPGSFGLVATGPGGPLNVSLATDPPPEGRIGLFCQSAPMAVTMLAAVRERGLGISELVSAGNRADVSGNDLMQFWGDDERTDVVGLHLESIGNPRKFTRVARRLAAVKPVVVVAGRSGPVVPAGHAVRPTHAPRRTLDEVLRQAGVVRVEDVHQLLDVAQLFAHQPLPAGRRVALLTSSPALTALAAQAASSSGLVVSGTTAVLAEDATPEEVRIVVDALYADPDSDAVAVVRVPTLDGRDHVLAEVVAAAAARTGRPTVACLDGLRGVTEALTAPGPDGRPRTVPAYPTPETALLALGRSARYARWRTDDRGHLVHPDGVDVRAARRVVAERLPAVPTGALPSDDGPLGAGPADAVPLDAVPLDAVPLDAVPLDAVPLDQEATAQLLACVGVAVLPAVHVRDADEAVAAAERIGWPVALKTTVPALRHRADLGGVRLDVVDEQELRVDVAEVLALAASHHADPAEAPLEVQAMAPHGSSCVVRSVEDPLFGPVISFGLAGDASDLLGDVTYGVPPLTDVDVAALVRSARAAPRLFGYRGLPALDVDALEDVIARVAVLADALPELRSLELNPVVVSERGAVVLGARAVLAHADRTDTPLRRLRR
ncbi:bifunctional acetate--CoA ligase family protein/GNAT family N-acetyltransferase [Cellulomonas soli]|uniref:GNAT family N-acetyltransferase n=1 Tax=Cellulomonas soli TaxID=931535 RepID=A0A512P9U3_9CELL|nr:GNAT family N-acetyltransferase [Cellulomonas soli]NYI60456.1 acyl-CoA synthetase (NDP forming)/RimJ/RimL family protein N-acetyltransferase [Cellulomonas soli]GEP67971.1 GNAT family N-acetyltransferase [Cellulomonas soli]